MFLPSLFAAFILLYHTLFASFFLLPFQCSHFTPPFFTLLCIHNKCLLSGLFGLAWFGLLCLFTLEVCFYGVIFSLAFSSHLEFTFWEVWFFFFLIFLILRGLFLFWSYAFAPLISLMAYNWVGGVLLAFFLLLILRFMWFM